MFVWFYAGSIKYKEASYQHILISIIYLLQEHKLNHINYFEWEINMENFV
jgi:hypothetical protein